MRKEEATPSEATIQAWRVVRAYINGRIRPRKPKRHNPFVAGGPLELSIPPGKVGISGAIEYRDSAGNIIKTVPFSGTASIDQKPITPEGVTDGNVR